MPEYGYSTAYRGMNGGALPPGALEAMTAPGRNIGRGIEKIGEGVASMIQRYQQTKAERDLASGELEGLIAQYIPQAQALPSGETGGVDLGQFGKIVGERNVKKFVEGKASTSDMLAMAHSIKTAQAEKDRALNTEIKNLQIDEYKRQQMKDVEAVNQGQIATDVARYAMGLPESTTREVQTTSMQQPVVQPSPVVFPAGAATPELPPHLRLLSTQSAKPAEQIAAEMAPRPVTTTNIVTEPIGYEAKRKMLADYALKTGAKPEIFAALDNLLAMAGNKPTQVVQSGTAENGATWVNVNGKTEIFAPQKIEGKDLTADQANALNFASRLALNDKTVNETLARGYTPKTLMSFSMLPERWKTDDRKTFEAAKQNWIAAALRKESGAAISEKEYSDADKQYFPQEGDPKAVLDQKAKLRETVFRTMKLGVGKHGDEYLTQVIGKPQEQGGLPRVKFNPALGK